MKTQLQNNFSEDRRHGQVSVLGRSLSCMGVMGWGNGDGKVQNPELLRQENQPGSSHSEEVGRAWEHGCVCVAFPVGSNRATAGDEKCREQKA